MHVYGACLFYVCCIVTGWGMSEVCCVTAVGEDSVFKLWIVEVCCRVVYGM